MVYKKYVKKGIKGKKKVEIDISGRIDQRSYNSVIFMLSEDNSLENSIFLNSELKRKILNKNKHIQDVIVKLHCILIYYCIRDYVNKISEIKVCPDCSPKKIDQYLKFYFKDYKEFDKIRKRIKGVKHSSLCHKKALRTFRKKEKPKLKITEEMVLKLLNKKGKERK